MTEPVALPKTTLAPKLTKDGIMRATLADALFQKIQQFYRSHTPTPEVVEGYIYHDKTGAPASKLTELPLEYRNELHQTLQPVAEAWVNRKIVPTFVYGIRTYYTGAVLKTHVDRDKTHIVSAILNVDQKGSVPWPLYIQSEQDAPHPWRQAYLAPGEILFYEGNRLQHGRPLPLEGEFFANIFIHYGLAD